MFTLYEDEFHSLSLLINVVFTATIWFNWLLRQRVTTRRGIVFHLDADVVNFRRIFSYKRGIFFINVFLFGLHSALKKLYYITSIFCKNTCCEFLLTTFYSLIFTFFRRIFLYKDGYRYFNRIICKLLKYLFKDNITKLHNVY